ncbi:MAG: ATP-binding protein [Nevskiaceae bacterium]
MRLFWKLFLLQLLAITAVLAGVVATTRANSVRGFAEFVEKREVERIAQIAERLGEGYEHSFDLGEAWDELPAQQRGARRPPPPPPEGVVVRRHVVRAPLQLQDAQGNYLRGERELPLDHAMKVPIESGGKLVGYLAWPRAPRGPDELEFAHTQFKHLVRIAPIALLIAAAFAALITSLIVRPIRQISGGAAALSRREFGTRLPEGRRDELGELATDFNRLATALEGYDTRQRQWLADIAHELRTPLAVLRGEIEAILDGLRSADAGSMRSLRQEVGRLEALVQDLQLVSQAEAGALRLNLAATDLAALVQHSAERFGERLKARGFSLSIDAAPGLSASVDAQRIEQVLANLIENAMRHASPPGPVTLTARADGGFAALSVADAGPGVPADALPRMFDRLYRVEAARTRAAGGAGLGLSICKSIVEAHGGKIRAQASATGGLEIVVTLPVGAPVGAAHGRDR